MRGDLIDLREVLEYLRERERYEPAGEGDGKDGVDFEINPLRWRLKIISVLAEYIHDKEDVTLYY